MRIVPLWMLLVGCAGTEPDTETDTDDKDDDTPTVVALILLTDNSTGQPLEGVVATSALETVTSDDEGLVEVKVEQNAPFDVLLEYDEYYPLRIQGEATDAGFAFARKITSLTDIDAINTTLGTSYDLDTKGVVTVSVSEVIGDGQASLAGVVVALSGTYAEAYSYDASAPAGIALDSDETVTPSGTVGFVEVEPGAVTATVSPPDGYRCEAYPGGTTALALQVHAGHTTTGAFVCVAE